MKGEKPVLWTYVLIGFLESGRSNVICVTQAEDDYSAAAKLGGHLVEPTEIEEDDMRNYSFRLPPDPSGVSWSQFKFDSDESIEKLEKLYPEGKWFNSVKNVGKNCNHLVLACVPFLE